MGKIQKKEPEQQETPEKLVGQLERITFHADDNDYTVARVKVKGYSDVVTVVGNIPSPTPGEILEMTGEWIKHPKFGAQFKIATCTTSIPASVAGIAKYLGSGLIKGVGPVMAKKIVSKFGEKTLEILEKSVLSLMEIPGIGRQRVEMIGKAWHEQKEIRSVMLFLQSNGVSSGYASKIYRQYGKNAITIVNENPYRLAYDISGIGFKIADQIAQHLGFDAQSVARAEAGVLFVLSETAEEGHTYYPMDLLINRACSMLEVPSEIVEQAIQSLQNIERIVIEEFLVPKVEKIDTEQSFCGNYTEEMVTCKGVFLRGFHIAENEIANMLNDIKNGPRRLSVPNAEKALEFAEENMRMSLAELQKAAVKASVENKVLVITGQPGTGKTTITKSILKIFSQFTDKILLAAPTGRAAKRMSEATYRPAKTIHRLLEYNVTTSRFQKNENFQLDCDLIIIDESSMIDTILMYHLLKAIPQFATVIFIGDINQLPSVGAGSVLRDIIDSNTCAVVELNEIFRQGKYSNIIVNAQKINSGEMPFISHSDKGDFFFIEQEDPEKATNEIVTLARDRIANKFHFNPQTEIQVLTPMNRNAMGTAMLNDALQDALNPDGFEIVLGARKFRIGDKVMQIKNDYDKDVFNGDIGFISHIDAEEHAVFVNVDGRSVRYDYAEMDELVLAYAVSIHKSQGSEYPAVIIPVVMAHYIMLARNLIYTAVTRGKKLVILIGSKKALYLAVKNDKTAKRFTRLKARLEEKTSNSVVE